ncbi:MAG: 6-phosphogluconolactonase [Gemmatimonadota bacterium]
MAVNAIVLDPDALAQAAAQHLARRIQVAAAENPARVTLALSGGRGPRPVFERLSAIPGLPWPTVEVFFADERAVPPDHPESNFHLVQDALVSRLSSPPRAVHRMAADAPSLEEAAHSYALGLPPALDILVLGIGDDGHTASLFPGHEAVLEEQRLVVPAVGPMPPHQRLTITPPVIRAARVLIMLAAGAGKASAIARACEGPDDLLSVPAQLARRGTWIMDRDAASQLRHVPS